MAKEEETKEERLQNQRLERDVIKRIKKGEKFEASKKIRKPSTYVKHASNMFSNTAISLNEAKLFKDMKKDLIKGNVPFLPVTYISIILFTVLISFIVSIFLFLFFLFFNIGALPPFITMTQTSILTRLIQVIWLILVIPILTFFLLYMYPSMEKRSLENKVNHELPFVMINMSAISGSMIEPSKIFDIIVSTGEFPNVSNEFRKVINEVNVHGFDLVSALRESASNTSSKKLAELLNGLATSITSGGDLPKFFDERAKSFLFEHRIER